MFDHLEKDDILGETPKRKQSTTEERRSLIDKYQNDLKVDDIGFYDKQKSPTTKGQTEEKPKNCFSKLTKKQKFILIGGISTVLLIGIILTIVLLAVRSKSPDNPQPTPPDQGSYNTYKLTQVAQQEYGIQTFLLKRDASINTAFKGLETDDNKFIDNVQLNASLIDYSTLRLQIKNADQKNVFEVPQEYLSQDYLNKFNQGLRFTDTGFKITQNDDTQHFDLKAYSLDKYTPQSYLNSTNFVAMTNYMQFGFVIDSNQIFGLGERITDFALKESQYTLFPYANSQPKFDNGIDGGENLQSQHPFFMAYLNNNRFLGVFLFNSNAQEFQIKRIGHGVQKTEINIIAVGGMLDLFIFEGSSFKDVLRSYQNVIGKPKMLPLWAHGLHSRSDLYKDINQIKNYIELYDSLGIKLESIILPQEAMINYTNFDFTINQQDFKTQFKDTKLILPFTYFIPDIEQTKPWIEDMLKLNYAVNLNNKSYPVSLGNLNGYCIDFFNHQIQSFLKTDIFKNQDLTNIALIIDNNTPLFNDQKQLQSESNPFEKIYVPGKDSRGELGKNTLPSQAQHLISAPGSDPEYQYHYYLHGLFGNQMAYQLNQNLPKDSFIISDSTYPGAGSKGIAHIIPSAGYSQNSLKQDLTNILNFNLFGMPYVSPLICGQKATNQNDYCARSYQLSIVTPLAISMPEIIKESQLKENYAVTQSLVWQRMAYMIYQRTELFKIQSRGGALVRPIIAAFPSTWEEMLEYCEDSVMYGEFIKVDFALSPAQISRVVYFPGSYWAILKHWTPQSFSIKD